MLALHSSLFTYQMNSHESGQSVSKQRRLQSGDFAPNVQVVNADGETIELSSLWSDKPVVLSFLRHFG